MLFKLLILVFLLEKANYNINIYRIHGKYLTMINISLLRILISFRYKISKMQDYRWYFWFGKKAYFDEN